MSTENANRIKYNSQRDSKGRPIYLTRLPLWKRYPRLFIVGGGILVGTFPWINALYQNTRFNPEDIPYQADWWPGEKRVGKRYSQQMREKFEKQLEMKEEYERLIAAKNEAAAAAKAKLVAANTTKK